MYTEHNQTKKNKKALLLLLVLGVFGFVAFKYTKIKDIVANENNTEASSCGTTVTDNSYDYTSKYFLVDDSGTISDITPQKNVSGSTVLGTSSVGGCTTNSLYSGNLACVKSTNSFSINGKSFMASDVTITLDSITAPLILFSGSNKLEIKDSNRNNPGVYKPAGGQYDDKQMLVYTTPGENHDEVKNELAKAPVKTNFGTQYSIATSDTAKSDPQGNVVVDKYINSDCVECNNISNPNPVKTNESSIRLMNYHFTTPDKVDNNENSNTVAVTGECTPYRDLSLLSLIRPTVCSNPINVLLGTLGSLFPSHDWNQCNPEKDTGCVSSEDLVVKMNPIFKETNEYMGARNASAMNPQAAKSYVPIYVLTSCIARITAKSGASIDVGVKCVWDMSYLFYENGASAYDNSPTLDDTMSDDQYIKYLQGETVSRGSESLTSM